MLGVTRFMPGSQICDADMELPVAAPAVMLLSVGSSDPVTRGPQNKSQFLDLLSSSAV